MKKYVIGIDLGTTNCTMSYTFLEDRPHKIEQFKIPQITKGQLLSESFSLPSFIYFPLKEELENKLTDVQWSEDRKHIIGEFAKERGLELPQRVIASAKSWACFSGVDRREPFLPMHSELEEGHLSPLESCSLLLKHLKDSWNYKMKDAPFNEADVLITVPASFDPGARELIKESANLAGYPEIVLLEEPQAAFYAWLNRMQDAWRKKLKVDDSILVVDIGGGTTDFSLISVESDNGDLSLKRVAVGDHLLLGGDNIDLSLAYFVKNKFEEEGHRIDEGMIQALTHSCRAAKEKLLSSTGEESVDITVMGRGSRLIGKAIKTKITKDEVQELVVNGFIPFVEKNDVADVDDRSGLKEIGLPYAKDPRISSQLARFLSNAKGKDTFVIPTAILFNGGTLKSEALRKRIEDLINRWALEEKASPVEVLEDLDLDYAVSIGAVYYGLSRHGETVRIKSGIARSYYIGVEESGPAIPGVPKKLKAICVAPFGMEEGTTLELSHQEFALTVGKNAVFRFFSQASPELKTGQKALIGSVVKDIKSDLKELYPIEALMKKDELDGKMVRVKLKSTVTELGFLELFCESLDGRRWKLEFDVRHESTK